MAAGGAERDNAIGKMVTGTGVAAYIAHKTLSGDVTGSGPKDPKTRADWEATGRRPYSVRTTDPNTNVSTWTSYASLEPIATVVGAAADAARSVRFSTEYRVGLAANS